MKQLLLFMISLTSWPTWPFPNLGNCPPANSSNFQILKKVAVIGSDERMTYEDYARSKKAPLAEIEKKFAATGALVCAGIRSSAQLSGKNNVITTAGHAFHRFGCRPLDDLDSCYYIHNPGLNETYHELKTSTIRFGGCGGGKTDWGVAELKTKIKGVSPYLIPSDQLEYQSGMPVVMTAGGHKDFHLGDRYTRTLTDCRIRDVVKESDEPLRTDCDSGKNSSGGAHLVDTAEGMQIVSVNSGGSAKFKMPNSGTPYDKDKNYNVAVPLSGDFLKAVRETIANAK